MATATATSPRLKARYHDEVAKTLMTEFGYSNVMQVPAVVKVAVNIGLGEAIENAKAVESATGDLRSITGQQPYVRRSKKAISNFKLREGNVIGLAVTLRGARMWEFLDRLMSAALPRVRDFHGVSADAFDAFMGNMLSRRAHGTAIDEQEAGAYFAALGSGHAKLAVVMDSADTDKPPTRTQTMLQKLRDRYVGYVAVDVAPEFKALRMVKTPYELGMLTRATDISADAQKAGMRAAAPGAFEYQVKAVGYDPWGATQLATQLFSEGIPMIEVRQGYRTLSEPAKRLEALVLGKKLRHNDNHLLNWAVSNCVLDRDPADNVKPSKSSSTERIDPLAALVTGLATWLHEKDESGPSVYEERDIEWV